jgi:hypothetical protein
MGEQSISRYAGKSVLSDRFLIDYVIYDKVPNSVDPDQTAMMNGDLTFEISISKVWTNMSSVSRLMDRCQF